MTGEPGIGKTRLLDELVRRAGDRGWPALRGGAAEFERALPFGVLVDALDEALEDPDLVAALADDDREALAAVFPALGGRQGRERPVPGERHRLHRAVQRLLDAVAADRPLVLALDDLHWADGASLELLGQLRRRRPHGAVLVAGAYRDDPAARGPALAGGARPEDVAVELGPLPRTAALALVPSATEHLYETSGGNPFYLLELARAPQADDDAVPRGITDATSAELARLPARARRFAEGAAVAGDPFELDVAAAAADLPEAEALEALDALVAAGIVRPTALPRRFRFRHSLVRRAVRDAFAPGARIAAHARCAALLSGRGASASTLAHHVEHAARAGDEAAVAVLREAGEDAAAHAPQSAARWFEVALGLLGDGGDADARCALLLDLAGVRAATGRFEESRAALLDALALVPPDDEAQQAQLVGAIAGVEQMLGRHEAARERLSRALRTLDAPAGAAAADLMLGLAVGDFYRMDYPGMHAWGGRATTAAAAARDPALVATGVAVLAVADAFLGEIPSAEAGCDRASALVDALPDEAASSRLDALAHLATAELYLHRYEAAGRHAERGLALARDSGQAELSPVLVPVLANTLHARGEIARAAELLDGAIEAARLAGNAPALGWALLGRAFTAVAAGDHALAVELARESLDTTRRIDDSLVTAYANLALADALCQSDQPDRAVDALLSGAGGEELSLVAGGWRANYFELLTRCRLAQGRGADAARCAATTAEVAADTGLPLAVAMARRAEAAVALAVGRPERASALAFAGADAADASGAVVEAARARVLAGVALGEGGEQERAIRELETAARELAACGAHGYRREAEAALRRLGRRFHRRAPAARPEGRGAETLTGRELEVARLVIDRRTNVEIASRLYVSEKTIESHMRNIFRKLDVSSRADVARMLEQADGLRS